MHVFVERFPRAVRAPYDSPDPAVDRLHGVDTETWRQARRTDREAALREPLALLPVTEYEAQVLRHIAEIGDTDTVAVLNAVLHRARAAAPLAGGAR